MNSSIIFYLRILRNSFPLSSPIPNRRLIKEIIGGYKLNVSIKGGNFILGNWRHHDIKTIGENIALRCRLGNHPVSGFALILWAIHDGDHPVSRWRGCHPSLEGNISCPKTRQNSPIYSGSVINRALFHEQWRGSAMFAE
jgi:hypothetical protein